MTNTSQIKRGIFASIFAVLFAVVPFAHAADVVGGIDMQNFSADIFVTSDAHVTVTETITGEFQTPHHGIYRNIPYRYIVDGHAHDVPLHINSVTRDGAAVPYSDSKEEGSVVLKIGDADTLASGPFTYVIVYEAERVVLAKDEGSFFAWDAPGDAWEDAFARVAVHVATDAPNSVIDAHCYTGAYGSTDECTVKYDDSSAMFVWDAPITTAVLFDATAVVVPEESILATLAYNHIDYLFFLLPIATLALMFAAWWRKGRDPAGRGVIVPEYEPPKDMGPAEVGALHDGRVHKHDIVAMIVDLAVRGYIVIEERGKHYALVRTEKGEEGLRDYEALFVRTAFGNDKEIELNGRVERFGRAWKAASKALYIRLQSDGYFVKNPEVVRGVFVAVGILLFIPTWYIALNFSSWSRVPCIAALVTAVIVILFGLHMPQRTAHGVKMWEHVQGYRLYLSTAEKYRLAWQEQQGVFERYLPYALALGVADMWTKELGPTLKEQPTWYRGSHSRWNTWYFMYNMHAFSSAMSRCYAVSTASSRSGGGGFSGGGFGGGGGGGW